MYESTVDDVLEPLDEEVPDHIVDAVAKRPRLRVTRVIVLLAGLFFVVGGFIGGVLVEKHWGGGSTGSTTSNFGPPNFGGAGNGGPSAATGSAGTTGTVTRVEGTTLSVTLANGTVVTVKTDGSTTVSAQSTSTVKDLKVGQSVTVTGTTASDGSVTATRITQAP
jgi:hypothetical protein